MRHLARLATPMLAAMTLAGCVTASSPSVTPKPQAFDPAPVLATVPAIVCHETGLSGQLESDPNDPKVAWFATTDGARHDVMFPTGYTGRFVDAGDRIALEVLDEQGRVFMGTNASPRKTCDAGIPGTVLLMQTSD